MIVLGGAPSKIREKLTRRFGERASLVFEPKLLNPSESRNIGLGMVKTQLAVLMDNDVYVRPGWLKALLKCQAETAAAMVVPLILETEERIHTAGNDLLITYRNGVRWGQKVLRYHKHTVYEGTNLKRCTTDYGELHCQLVEVETARTLGVYDEHLREAGEVDSGLTWAKAGCGMFFEPTSVVVYKIPDRILHAEDIRPFIFKWDLEAIRLGYIHFKRKWDLDITECGNWVRFNVMFNNKLGLVPRFIPSSLSLLIDNNYHRAKRLLKVPTQAWKDAKAKLLGANRWSHK